MKVNGKCVKNMCGLGVLLVVSLTAVSCMEESGYSKLMRNDYPELYTHVFNRNADSIMVYTEHPKEHVRQQAWRSLISTPIEDMDGFIARVIEANTPEAWMALSAKDLTEDQVSMLHDLWDRQNSLRKGISLVLGQSGNNESLDFLLRNFENIIGSEYEYEAALAIGRLMRNHELNEMNLRSIVRYAAVREDADLFRAYLYGLYRSAIKISSSELQDTLWETYEWSRDPQIQQYALSICMNSDAEKTINRLSVDDLRTMNTQVAIDLVRRMQGLDWDDKVSDLYEVLLEHENPVVNTVALEMIATTDDRPGSFDSIILEKIVEDSSKEASVKLSGLIALQDASDFIERAEELASGDSYLQDKKMQVYQNLLMPQEYLAEIQKMTSSDEHMDLIFSIGALQRWWSGLDVKGPQEWEEVKQLVFQLLSKEDRSITYLTLNFMENSDLFGPSDYEKIKTYFTGYKLPADIEVFQALGSFLKATYEDEAKEWISQLASLGNATLNNTFKEQGWDVPEMESDSPTFRIPDWDRLAALGYEPIWILETNKGMIKIKMDVISAPATISGMDSLSRSGAYDGVAFHRVVPNFVIQGGDIESGDGFGGPDYVVPTEASVKEYKRGKVGIASAGTDTEGSQYFVMHDWAPHLNGRYTVIGEVVEGMDVVDRILVGDRVIKSYWEGESKLQK